MKEIFGGVAIALFLIGLFNTIYATAQDTAGELEAFANDMQKAMSCATKGISIYTCAPNLNPQNLEKLEQDLENYENLLKQTQNQIEKLKLNNTNI